MRPAGPGLSACIATRLINLKISYLRVLLMTGIETKRTRIICMALISFGLFIDLLHIGWSYPSLIRGRATSARWLWIISDSAGSLRLFSLQLFFSSLCTGRIWLIPIRYATFAAGLWSVSDSVPPLSHCLQIKRPPSFKNWVVNYERGWGGGIGTVMI